MLTGWTVLAFKKHHTQFPYLTKAVHHNTFSLKVPVWVLLLWQSESTAQQSHSHSTASPAETLLQEPRHSGVLQALGAKGPS